MLCQCASINPGITTRPPQSIVRDPSGPAGFPVATALIRPPSTMRASPPRRALDVPSNRRKFVKTIGGGGLVCARAGRRRPSAATEAPIPATNPRRDRSAVMRRVTDWSSPPQQEQPRDPSACDGSPDEQENMALLL